MNDEIQLPMMPESIQSKADILENNLFMDLKKSSDNTFAELTFKRKDTINVIVEKAMLQLLFRFNIYPAVLEDKLRESLAHELSDKEEDKLTLNIPIDDPISEIEGVRHLKIVIGKHDINLSITGKKAIPQKNEKITRYYFEYEEYPGKLLPNGKFDFRELHKFPSVKKGDKLLFIRYPVNGKSGVAFDGSIIPVLEPTNYKIELQKGVVKHELVSKHGVALGYYVISGKTGVVIMKKVDNYIREIDVNNIIELEKIDYSIGNIGSEFISPVSMKIGTINEGFKIRAHGNVEVKNLDGGHVATEKDALIDQIRPGSSVSAKHDIVVRTVADSELNTKTGTITIGSEIRDSTLKGHKIKFKSTKGMMLNNVLETIDIELSNIYYCGTNDIYLGKDLFKQRMLIYGELEQLKKSFTEVQNAIDSIKLNLLSDLKDLGSQITDDNLKNLFKLLIQTLQTFTFADSFKILENLKKHMNVKKIDAVTKSFHALQKLSDKISEYQKRTKDIGENLTAVESSINSIKFSLNGQINPTATVKIYCNPKSMDDPVYEIKPVNKEGNEKVAVTGRFNLKDGFVKH